MKIARPDEPRSNLQFRNGDWVGLHPERVICLNTGEAGENLEFEIMYDPDRRLTVQANGFEVIRQLGTKLLIRIDCQVLAQTWPKVEDDTPKLSPIQIAKKNAKKTCRRCGVEQLLTNFGRDLTKWDKRKTWCRSCVAEWTRATRKRHREARKWESRTESTQAFRAVNPQDKKHPMGAF